MPVISYHCNVPKLSDLVPLSVQFRNIWPNLAPRTSQGWLWSRARAASAHAAIVHDSQMQVCARLCGGLYGLYGLCEVRVWEGGMRAEV